MPNVYLHNRLFDFIHKYKDDLQVEFLKNTKHLPKNYFTDKQTKDKVSLSYRLKKISRKIINTNMSVLLPLPQALMITYL